MRRAHFVLAVAVLSTLLATATRWAGAQTETVLYSFTGGTDGGSHDAGLVLDTVGNLYGTTPDGGFFKDGCGSNGCGTVFKVTPSGSETVLYAFTGENGNGKFPLPRLVQDADGNLYGTTAGGGDFKSGTVFELAASGTETVLYSFKGAKADGAVPGGGLVRDTQGNFYGTTVGGGSHYKGTVFKLTPAGAETVLYNFQGRPDGSAPGNTLVRAAGNLYGTASDGGSGAGCASPGCGVVFEITPYGTDRALHVFTGAADGARPAGGLVRDALGNFYGTAAWGGTMNSSCPQGCGTVFELSPNAGDTWSFTVLHSFTGEGDGYHPVARLVGDAHSNLYGITSGDTCSVRACSGTVFEIAPDGTETVLHNFTGGVDGQYPFGDLALDKKGNLYGTTQRGGTFNNGTVFKVTP